MRKHTRKPNPRWLRSALRWAAMVFAVGWVIFLVMVFYADRSPAQAGWCAAWGYRTYCRGAAEGDAFSLITGRSCVQRRVCRQWVHAEPHYERESYRERERRYYRMPEVDHRERRRLERCRWNTPIRVTGDDKLDERTAEISAQDRWAQTVEARFGTIFSDVQNAQDLDVMCVRKVPSSATEKVQAIGGVRHFVCEIEAVPCPPERQEKDDDSRAKRWHERRDEKRERRSDVREPDAPGRP